MSARDYPGSKSDNPYGLNANTVYLSPAPLYHAAPFGFALVLWHWAAPS